MTTIPPFTGFGLGLRRDHYADFLAAQQPVDFVEVISENFMVEGGCPLATLDAVRERYRVALHGVSMSIGSATGLDRTYLTRLKALADRVRPLWVSDHLCWTGVPGHTTHDLLPLPYTEEALKLVATNLALAQDVLERPLLLENPSSYVAFDGAELCEWEFLDELCARTGCYLLIDVNNIFVSAGNHGFDPLAFLDGLPADRVRQVHLAGHSQGRDMLIDTHDAPVCDGVWALYEAAVARFGPAATMIERDDAIPPAERATRRVGDGKADCRAGNGARGVNLATLQRRFHAAVSASDDAADGAWEERARQGIRVYRNAYRARLVACLRDTYARTLAWVGDEAFEAAACHHAIRHPPDSWTLDDVGREFDATLGELFPSDPDVSELASLEWAMQAVFTGPDAPALDAAVFAGQTAEWDDDAWSALTFAFVPTLVVKPVTTNCAAVWTAIETDGPRPAVLALERPAIVAVWRAGFRSRFKQLSEGEAACLDLARGGATFGAL